MAKTAAVEVQPGQVRTEQRLMVVGAGCDAATTLKAASRLADLLALPLAGWPDQAQGTATARLASLAERSGPWLAPLPLDPGQWIEPDGRWADSLGSWRQPTLLLITAAAAGGGIPAAYSALLKACGVPLVGLIQWGGPWDGPMRRREGLAWLGMVGEEIPSSGSDQDAEDLAMAAALQLGWQHLALA